MATWTRACRDTVTLVRLGDFEPDPTLPYFLHEAFDINIDPTHWSTAGFERAGNLDGAIPSVERSGWGTYWGSLAERLRAIVD